MSRICVFIALSSVLAACKNDQGLVGDDDGEPVETQLEACIEVTPTSVAFADLEVDVDPQSTQVVTVQNTCDGDLEIYGLLLADGDVPFTIGTIGSIMIPGGTSTEFTVTFDPKTAASWETMVLIESNDADTPTTSVPITGTGIAPVIEVTPAVYDFGAPYLGCTLEQPFTIANVGNADLDVDSLEFATGTVDFEFESGLELPVTIEPGQSVDVTVRYAGFDEFDDQAFLTVGSNDPTTPEVVATITADAQFYGNNADVFEQPLRKTADILFVVDNSCSMGEEQASLADNFEAFVDTLIAADSDYHLAVITTDDPGFRGPVITTETSNPVDEFQTQALAGVNGSATEEPLEMAFEATQAGGDAGPGSAFLRDNSTLSIVILTDEEDSSPGDPEDYIDYWLGLKSDDADLVRVHAIAGMVPSSTCSDAVPATVANEAVNLTGGTFVDICSTDWGENLEEVAEGSITVHDSFPLTEQPVPATIEVTIDGIWTTTGWSYDGTNNSIVFEPASIPAGGSSVEIAYDLMPDCEG